MDYLNRNPILLKHLDLKGNLQAQTIFPNTAPEEVKNAIVNENSKILNNYYGPKYQEKLGLNLAEKDRKIGSDDLPDDIIGDLFDSDNTNIPNDKSSEPEPIISEHNISTKISDIVIFPEDRILDLKYKIYVETGIPIYKQHIFYIVKNGKIPLSYTITVDQLISIDILQDTPDRYYNIPIDNNLWQNKDILSVTASDSQKQVKSIYENTGSSILYLVNLSDILDPISQQLREIAKSDHIQIELLYYGFIYKFYPMITAQVFEMILHEEQNIKTAYPDLLPSKTRLGHVFAAEKEILSRKYELLENPTPEFNKFAPINLTTSNQSKISVNIKSANLTVELDNTILTNRIQIDPVRLFETMHTNDKLPIIKANLFLNNKSTILTKIHSSNNIQKIYDSVKYRLKIQYPGYVLFVIPIETYYMVVVVSRNGKYTVRLSWEDESNITFSTVYSTVYDSVNRFITELNNLGRTIFASSTRLPLAKSMNSRFGNLSLHMFWYRSLGDQDYQLLMQMLKKDFEAECFKQPITQEDITQNTIIWNMYKGMTDTISDQNNQTDDVGYNWLSEMRAHQRHLIDDVGKLCVLTRRTTDVRFDITNMSDAEFKYFYQYMICRLFDISNEFGKFPKSTKLQPILEKNRLKMLKERDPKLYKFKKFGSNVVYSRICQKQHQPEIYYQNEFDILPNAKKSKAVKYWNFTNLTPMYYVCPNPIYPHLSFITGQHPKNYCLPCCKKTEISYEYELTTKKGTVYNECLENLEYIDKDTGAKSSRYIMTYNKPLDIGRISYVPPLLDKYILYNIESEEPQDNNIVPVQMEHEQELFSIDNIWKLSKNNKIRELPIEEFTEFLNQKAWNYQIEKTKRVSSVQYSPQEILDNPNLSASHYNRISNADLSYPILVYRNVLEGWQRIIDGLHRLARAYMLGQKTIHVKYITRRQLTKARVQDAYGNSTNQNNDNTKKPGYYLYGVPQSLVNIDSVGALYSISTALRLTPEDFLERSVSIIKSHAVFRLLLSGNILKYFQTPDSLISVLRKIGQPSVDIGHFDFTKWNELFMDLAKYCFNTYCIIFDDRSIDTVGTSIKHSYDDIQLILHDKIQDSSEFIPTSTEEHPVTREYILLLRKRKKSKTIFAQEYYYYPIFIFIPHEFFKTLEIKKRIFIQSDPIILTCKTLIDSTLNNEETQQKNINLPIVLKFLGHLNFSIQKIWKNLNNKCYAVMFDNVVFPIVESDYSTISLTANILLKRSDCTQTYMDCKKIIQSYNKWVVEQSKLAGAIRIIPDDSEWLNAEEKSIVPIYPLIKISKFLQYQNNLIGFVANELIWYFKPVPSNQIHKITKFLSKKYPTIISTTVSTLLYDPDHINTTIVNSSGAIVPFVDKRVKQLPQAQYNKQLYHMLITTVMNSLDKERNHKIRNKLKKIIISNKSVQKMREEIKSELQFESDLDVIESFINIYVETLDKKSLLTTIEDTIFTFDKITLNKLRIISDNFKQSTPSEKKNIYNKLTTELHQISKNVLFISNTNPIIKTTSDMYKKNKLIISRHSLDTLLSIFAMDLVNPLRRDYLLSGIYSISTDKLQILSNPNEQVLVEI